MTFLFCENINGDLYLKVTLSPAVLMNVHQEAIQCAFTKVSGCALSDSCH